MSEVLNTKFTVISDSRTDVQPIYAPGEIVRGREIQDILDRGAIQNGGTTTVVLQEGKGALVANQKK